MASRRLIARVERLAWILVYGGLFSSLVGWVSRSEDGATAAVLMGAGGAAVAGGIVLVLLRARMREPLPTCTDTQGKT